MKSRLFFVFILAILLISFLVIACGGSETTTPKTTAPAVTTQAPATAAPSTAIQKTTPPQSPTVAQPQTGGVLKIIERTTPKALGLPAELTTTNWLDAQPAVEALLRYPKKGSVPDPWLATKWEYSSDFKSLTLYLRKGIKFHDGTDFNAQAVKWNLDVQKGVKSEMDTVSSVDVVDDYTVRLNLSQFNNSLPMHLVGSIGNVVSPTAVQKNGVEWARMNPIGTGPFTFGSYERDISLKYQKFAGYWDTGKPYLDGVEIRFIPDQTVGDMALEKGEVDAIPRSNWKEAFDMMAKGFVTTTCPGVTVSLGWNNTDASSPFVNKDIRLAVEYAIDKETICKTLGYGFWTPSYQILPATVEGFITGLPERKYDPAKAKQLLASGGYPNGFATKVTISTITPKDTYIAVQSYLAAVGIKMDIETVAPTLTSTYQFGSKWEGLLPVSVAGMEPFTQALERQLSSVQYVSLARPAGWKEMLAQALAATTPAERVSLTRKMIQLAYDEALIAPLYFQQIPSIKKKSVRDDNMTSENYSQFFWTPNTAWLAK
jgi:ABC-type transport system substrate-binding protein